jgi:hypothetical protein
MAIREEVRGMLAAYFVAQEQKWDDRNYPYWADISSWEDHVKAAEAAVASKGNRAGHHRVVLVHLEVLNTGRINRYVVKPVWEDGIWVSDEHNPLMANPRFRQYLELKKEFENEV